MIETNINRYAQIIIKSVQNNNSDEVFYGYIKEINKKENNLILMVKDWRDRDIKEKPFFEMIVSRQNPNLIIKFKCFLINRYGKPKTSYTYTGAF